MSGNFSNYEVSIKALHANTDQEMILITEDKLRLVLNEHLNLVEKRNEWVAPLGLIITLLLVFVTSTFKDSLGIKAATWEAILIVATILSLCWLLRSLVAFLKSSSVNDVLEKIKKNSRDV